MNDFYWLKSGVNPFAGGGMDAEQYREMMKKMLALEPQYILNQVIKGQNPDENIKYLLKARLEDMALIAKRSVNHPGRELFFVREMFIVEGFIKQTFDRDFNLPEKFKKLLPRGTIREFRRESSLIANLWQALWHCLEKTYLSGVLNYHPSSIFYCILLESGESNLFVVAGSYPQEITAGNFIATNQKINAYLNNLSDEAENPFDRKLYATRVALKAIRKLANESNEFRKSEYKKFKQTRSALVKSYKDGNCFVISLDKTGSTFRNHLQGKKTELANGTRLHMGL